MMWFMLSMLTLSFHSSLVMTMFLLKSYFLRLAYPMPLILLHLLLLVQPMSLILMTMKKLKQQAYSGAMYTPKCMAYLNAYTVNMFTRWVVRRMKEIGSDIMKKLKVFYVQTVVIR